VKRALVLLAACSQTPVAPEAWQLDQDRVVAVRSTPPRLAPGEHALVDALMAHADGPTTIEIPSAMTAAHSPLFQAVNFIFDHWEVIGPDEDALVAARISLGLAPGVPVPLEMTVIFGPLDGAHFTTHKQIWLGESAANPALPDLAIDPIALDRDLALAADATDVRWLTSCGTLYASDEPDAILRIDEPCSGELAVVVRDDAGGTVWQTQPIRTP
jgi:hypothetical protein